MAEHFKWEDLTKEKNLWQIYVSSRSIEGSFINWMGTCVAFFGFVLFVSHTQEQLGDLASRLVKWAEFGFGFALNILGFLIAGFTIFATISKPELFLEMAQHTEKKSGLSYLKYNFFIFMKVFIYFLTFATICGSIVLLGSPRFPSVNFLREYFGDLHGFFEFGVRCGLVIVGTSVIFLLLQLKSFIFNIYHIVMTSLRWTAENDNQNSR